MTKKILLLLFAVVSTKMHAQVGPPPPCIPPGNITITDVTMNSATFSWTEFEEATAWEIIILPSGSPHPDFTSPFGILVNQTSFIASLVCGNTYDFYIRDDGPCPGPSFWGGPYTFSTLGCFGEGHPQNLTQCPSLNQACFDLTVNDTNILASLDPSQYTISYHNSYEDAATDANPITGTVCTDLDWPQPIFSRLEHITNGDVGIGVFRIAKSQTDCAGFQLRAFYDANGNSVMDESEYYFENGQFQYQANGGTVHHISSSGEFIIAESDPGNSYNLSFTINPEYAAGFTVMASYADVHAPVDGTTLFNFPIIAAASLHDVGARQLWNGPPRAGFEQTQTVSYTNFGNQVESGTITFSKDAVLEIASTNPETTPTTDGFVYAFTDLQPLERRNIVVNLQVPAIPTVSIGQTVSSSATVTVADDANPENDTSAVTGVVVGSYDPNDKTEAHGPQIDIAAFGAGDYLTYTIRFENTGTANAEDVKITDLLEDQLIPASVRLLASSHNCTMEVLGNQLVWKFDGIDLPPSSESDPTTGHGYVTFEVQTAPSVGLGDSISNSASIYFDFNPPIATEPFVTNLVEMLGTQSFDNQTFVIYPNPTRDKITVVSSSANIESVAIFDVSGKQIQSARFDQLVQAVVDVSSLQSGMYFVKVTADSGSTSTQKLIKK